MFWAQQHSSAGVDLEVVQGGAPEQHAELHFVARYQRELDDFCNRPDVNTGVNKTAVLVNSIARANPTPALGGSYHMFESGVELGTVDHIKTDPSGF